MDEDDLKIESDHPVPKMKGIGKARKARIMERMKYMEVGQSIIASDMYDRTCMFQVARLLGYVITTKALDGGMRYRVWKVAEIGKPEDEGL